MKNSLYYYTKSILETVSFDPQLFCKELKKALKLLLPYDVELLTEWLLSYTTEKPELRLCLVFVNK